MSAVGGNKGMGVGSFLLVTAVTLLIWIYAAGETQERAVIQAQLKFAPASSFTTIVSPQTTVPVALTLGGSARSIQKIRGALSTPLILDTGTDGIPSDKGLHSVELAAALRDQSVFDDADVSVLGVEPGTISLEIDSVTEKIVPVIPKVPGATLGGEVIVEPSKVTITIPSRLLALIPEASLIAAPSPEMIAEREPGRRQEMLAPIRLPEELSEYEDEITITPSSVQLAFTLTLLTRSLTLPQAVPVQIAGTSQDLDNYDVEIETDDQFLLEVVIEGAAETVKQFEEADPKPAVVAFIHLTSRDFAQGVTEAPVTLWKLPDGLRVTSVAGETGQPVVSLKITPREK